MSGDFEGRRRWRTRVAGEFPAGDRTWRKNHCIAISCGVYGYPLESAVKIAIHEALAWMQDPIIEKDAFVHVSPETCLKPIAMHLGMMHPDPPHERTA